MREPTPSRRIRTHELNEHGEPVVRKRRSFVFRLIRALVVLGMIGGMMGAGGLLWFLHQSERTPREWAPYLERRAMGHRGWMVEGTAVVSQWLQHADRLRREEEIAIPANVGASVARSGPTPPGRIRMVAGIADLHAAVAGAQPGDVITLLPGRYVQTGRNIVVSRGGTATAPIVVRAARLGDAVIELDDVVAFKISAPFWRFENLVVRGRSPENGYTEHAFHIVGGANNVAIVNNRLEDMNAQIKINGEVGRFPDSGVIRGNSFTNSKPRMTQAPVTPIDLVAGSGWIISDNFIADFIRGEGGKTTYGAFIKGAGEKNVMERNVVICEWKLRDPPGLTGERVGLSVGGGGTGGFLRRDEGRSGFEQTGGILRDNLIAFCSDVGIYVNKGSRTVIEHNTLLDTAGIDVRFPESSADVNYNVVDGVVRGRDGGMVRQVGNQSAMLLGLFIGSHPARGYFQDPSRMDLRWQERPAAVDGASGRRDLCGSERPQRPLPGAFEDYAACR